MHSHTRGFCGVGLHLPQNPINIGAALRAADCFQAQFLAISGGTRYRRTPTDTTAAYRRIPLFRVLDLHQVVPFDCVPVAVDLVEGAQDLTSYQHPERAMYIFGPENGTLGSKVLDWCRDRIVVPTNHCLNLAACVNVVLYDRISKQGNTNA